MSIQAGQQAPGANGGASASLPDADTAKYEALRKELGIEQEGGEPEPKPAPAEGEPPAEPEPRAKPEHVPYAEHENVQKALREARAAQKASDEQLARFMRIVEDARGSQRQPAEADKKEPPKIPDVLENPIEHFSSRMAQLEALLQQAQQGGQATTQQLQAWQQRQALYAAVDASSQDIRNAASANHKADYDDAVQYLATMRMKQLDLLYPDESPQVQAFAQQNGFASARDLKAAQLRQDEEAVAIQALQIGVSPALRYYELAQAAGYQQKAKPNGAADKGKQQIEATKKGLAASVSISGGSGRKGAQDMSITDLADMFVEDPDAADKIWEEMRKAGRLG